MGIREMSVEAEHGLDLIPNSPIVRETYGLDDTRPTPTRHREADRRRRHPLRRGLGLRDLRRLRRGLPGAHRARRQDRRAAAQPGPRGVALPGRADRRVPGHGGPGQPVGPAGVDPDSTGRRACPFEVPTVAALAAGPARLDELEVLYWVGCAAAFDERNRRVARAFATCLDAAGVPFAVLGQEESCTGDPARRMGNEYVFQILASGNVETLNRYGMGERTIVTACPHCFNTIGNEYGQLGGSFEVVHHSVYLQRLLAEGRLRVARRTARRRALRDVPRLVLPGPLQRRRRRAARRPRRRARARAARDGRSPARTRSAAAPAAGGCGWRRRAGRGSTPSGRARRSRRAPTTVATSCPFCMTMLKDGLADAAGGAAARDVVSARDIAEILADVARPGSSRSGAELPVLQ